MATVNYHAEDDYTSEWAASHAHGYITPLERANGAVMFADLALTIASERGDDLDKAQASAVMERVALAASACATATRINDKGLATQFADKAHSEALELSSFDYVNLTA